jgi:molybdenum cofactor cytidylyltransferase
MIDLRQSLRIDEYSQMAFVGAGGKSSAIFQLARDFAKPILISTSTHLGENQKAQADQHLIITKTEQIKNLEIEDLSGSLLLTGSLIEGNRWSALSIEQLYLLSELARKSGIPLLIEADGSRQKPLKAPADHEPAIPNLVDQVVVVSSISALGKPLSTESVHRPEHFAKLSGIKLGDPIDINGLVRVLTHADGGLKHIPADSRKVWLANQAENADKLSLVKKVAPDVLEKFDSVVGGTTNSEKPNYLRFERIGGVLLAAGESKRFGEAKQLLDWRGESFIKNVANMMHAARLKSGVIVLGANYQNIFPEVESLGLRIVMNEEWSSGQASSVKQGLAALPKHLGAAMFLQVDRPQVSASLINALVDEHSRSLSPIIAPQIDGQRATPVLFDRVVFPEFAQLEGDQGGRQLFSKYRVNWIPWLDTSQAIDVDTPEDYVRLQNYEN